MLNPESVALTGDIFITSMIKYTQDAIYSKIEYYSGPSNFQAVAGVLDSAKMIVTSLTNDMATAASNQAYQLQFTTTHSVSKGGFVKVILPETFQFSSVSSAIAQFTVMDADDLNYCSIFSVIEADMSIIGITNIDMAAKTTFNIRLGGLMNPRFQILNAKDDITQQFQVQTFDSNFNPSNSDATKTNLIDSGRGGYINIDQISLMTSFGAEAFNTSNGAQTKFFLSWFSNIPSQNTDLIYFTFPSELALLPSNGDALKCLGINGFT